MNPRMRRLVRVAAVVGIALAAGHLTQAGGRQTATFASVAVEKPVRAMPVVVVTQVAFGTNAASTVVEPPIVPASGGKPHSDAPALLVRPRTPLSGADCAPVLRASPGQDATVDLLLMAPCHPGQRVVLRHSGLVAAYQANAAGALFASFPALTADVEVSVLFGDGTTLSTKLVVPEAALHRRFAVQWMGPAVLSLSVDGMDARALMQLGDPAVEPPLLAEVFTFPPTASIGPVVIQAKVTEASCGHDILGETLQVERGAVTASELSVAMPDCVAVGDYLVLKNPAPGVTLASVD
jgi:hypothetical protein